MTYTPKTLVPNEPQKLQAGRKYTLLLVPWSNFFQIQFTLRSTGQSFTQYYAPGRTITLDGDVWSSVEFIAFKPGSSPNFPQIQIYEGFSTVPPPDIRFLQLAASAARYSFHGSVPASTAATKVYSYNLFGGYVMIVDQARAVVRDTGAVALSGEAECYIHWVQPGSGRPNIRIANGWISSGQTKGNGELTRGQTVYGAWNADDANGAIEVWYSNSSTSAVNMDIDLVARIIGNAGNETF